MKSFCDKSVKEQIFEEVEKTNITNIVYCNAKENKIYDDMLAQGLPLPPNVIKYPVCESYQRIDYSDAQDFTNLILLRSLSAQKTTKRCILFFTVLTIVNVIATIILASR